MVSVYKMFACTILVALCAAATAETLTGGMILDGLGVGERDRDRLVEGEVLAFDGEAWEQTARELSADATVLVNRPLADVLEQVQEVPTIIPQKYLLEHREISGNADFADVGFTAEEYEHADALLNAKVGKKFNLSKAEVAELRRIGASARGRDARLEAASEAMRKILLDRYRAYRATGLAGVAPYQRSSRKAISVGDELTLTTETFEPFAEYFPAYYRVMRNYPAGAECCEHIFRWLKVRIKKRPAFALTHTIIQEQDDFLLITERHFYVSSTLNSVQVTLSWVPWDQDTQMGLAVSASTDVLDSFMGRVLRPLGRNKARDLVGSVLTEIRDDLTGDGG